MSQRVCQRSPAPAATRLTQQLRFSAFFARTGAQRVGKGFKRIIPRIGSAGRSGRYAVAVVKILTRTEYAVPPR